APRTPPKRRGDIVLILDDVGFDRQPLDDAMQIDPNVSFSVLPNASRAGEFARRLNARGFEVLCHLPMEPLDFPRESPGPNAIMTSMSNAEIEQTTRDAVASVPYARGVNNHMGSRATRDRRVMTSVLSSLPKGLYFVDSRTVSGSIAENVAREMKIPTTGRDVFLDDVQSEPAVRHQLRELVSVAQERGSAVGIGHIYPVTVKVLREEIPSLRTRGIRLVRASAAVD
ncbi:MAG: divergent polysaccharide deacetylase family protein, partial [Thermoanaerobaculia bacterium]